jgi:hypothetical protein
VNPTSKNSADAATDAGWRNWLHVIAGGLALCLIGSYLFSWPTLPVNANSTALGAFGDYMGGLLNPLISLFTLIIAMKVWGLQKTELLETRKAVEEQGKTAEQQRREQRFFDFLNIYRSTVDSIEFEVSAADSVIAFKGKRAFKHLTSQHRYNPLIWLSQIFENPNKNPYATWTTDILDKVSSKWEETSPVLDHYFRMVFTILREANTTLKDDHWRYMKLFRAQLSRDETNLLAMNLLFDEEGKKMRPLVVSYGVLKHMPASHLREIAERELDPLSFGLKWADEHPVTPREEPHAD